jgi:hypothetical protein
MNDTIKIVITINQDDISSVMFIEQYLDAPGDNRCDLYFRIKDLASGKYLLLRSRKPIAVDKRLMDTLNEAGIEYTLFDETDEIDFNPCL